MLPPPRVGRLERELTLLLGELAALPLERPHLCQQAQPLRLGLGLALARLVVVDGALPPPALLVRRQQPLPLLVLARALEVARALQRLRLGREPAPQRRRLGERAAQPTDLRAQPRDLGRERRAVAGEARLAHRGAVDDALGAPQEGERRERLLLLLCVWCWVMWGVMHVEQRATL